MRALRSREGAVRCREALRGRREGAAISRAVREGPMRRPPPRRVPAAPGGAPSRPGAADGGG